MTKTVVFCIPTLTKPHPALFASLEAAIPGVEAAGWDALLTGFVGCPYISCARANMLRRALDAKADAIVFLDHDMGFDPPALLKLMQTEGDVVCGTYRFKTPEVEYMATIQTDAKGFPLGRDDGCLLADRVPAGFLKVTKAAVQRFMRRYPELVYGDPDHPSVDLFNHGAWEGVWYGEDYSFSRRWNAIGHIWLIPDLNLDHWSETECFTGNFHEFLLKQPGGVDDPARLQVVAGNYSY
jgi:glycosyltransferase involved in cell wall biosynthesis